MKLSPSRVRRTLVSFVLACACAVTGAVVTPQPAGAIALTDTRATDISSALFVMLNAERAAHGLYPLMSHPALRLSSSRHDGLMARYNTMSHQLPGEASLGTRISASGYNPWRALGENIAYNTNWTWSGAQYLQNLMYNEVAPNNGHRLNILSTTFRQVGITVWMDGTHHKMWITFDFGLHS
ncbi:MAG: hypothetical protein QOG80_2559 [Pseudonocardiales bacterium]|nr:hypothetical protein [Pseudonocardiales bacterium]